MVHRIYVRSPVASHHSSYAIIHQKIMSYLVPFHSTQVLLQNTIC